MKRNNGFTLVELLVVIAIISILTIITVSQFQTAKRKGNDVQRKSDLSSVSKALLMYFADYGNFPKESGGKLTNNLDGSAISWSSEFKDKESYTYMKVLPMENNNSLPSYCYKVDNNVNPKKFALFAQLENKQDKDCKTPTYSCNGQNYCYGIVSPNSNLTEAAGW